MWKPISTIATILSFASAFYLWVRVRKKIEEDPYYYYGDSMYRGDMKEEEYASAPPDMDDLVDQSGDPEFNYQSTMIH